MGNQRNSRVARRSALLATLTALLAALVLLATLVLLISDLEYSFWKSPAQEQAPDGAADRRGPRQKFLHLEIRATAVKGRARD